MPIFQPASRKRSRLRMAFDGPAGSGKTMTALRCAFALAATEKTKVAVIDTEAGSASLYEGEAPDGIPFEFGVLELSSFSPSDYTAAILAAAREGYGVIVIDSLSHAWNAEGGALDMVTKRGGNSFTAWKDVTPLHNRMVEAILRSPAHVIATLRTKTEYILETDEKGRQVPRKVGMAPIQRQGVEYEFSIVADMDVNHLLTVSKTRCSAVDGLRVVKPGADFMLPIIDWLNKGTETPEGYYTASEEELSSAVTAAEQRARLYAGGGSGVNGNANGPPAESVKDKLLRKKREAAEAKATTPTGPASDEPEAGSQGEAVAEPVTEQPPPFDADTNDIADDTDKSDHTKAKLVQRIRDLFERLGVPREDQQEAFKRRGVKALIGMSVGQLEELLDNLLAAELGLDGSQGEQDEGEGNQDEDQGQGPATQTAQPTETTSKN